MTTMVFDSTFQAVTKIHVLLNKTEPFGDFAKVPLKRIEPNCSDTRTNLAILFGSIFALGVIFRKRNSEQLQDAWTNVSHKATDFFNDTIEEENPESIARLPMPELSPSQIFQLQAIFGAVLVCWGIYELMCTKDLEEDLQELEKDTDEIADKISALNQAREECQTHLDDLSNYLEMSRCGGQINPDEEDKSNLKDYVEQLYRSLKSYRRRICETRKLLVNKIEESEKEARRIEREANSRIQRQAGLVGIAAVFAMIAAPGLPLGLGVVAAGMGACGAFWSAEQVRRARLILNGLCDKQEEMNRHQEAFNNILLGFNNLLKKDETQTMATREDYWRKKLQEQVDENEKLKKELAASKSK